MRTSRAFRKRDGGFGEPWHRVHHRSIAAASERDRPLTIGGHPRGIYRRGNEIVAPGGFSAHGYGYPVATADELRALRNADVRRRTAGVYGYGVDGLGGSGFEDNGETGYSNPYYGNGFNRYVGYNGVPTTLAFGPAFANRYITDHEPGDDEEADVPSPARLGYARSLRGVATDDTGSSGPR